MSAAARIRWGVLALVIAAVQGCSGALEGPSAGADLDDDDANGSPGENNGGDNQAGNDDDSGGQAGRGPRGGAAGSSAVGGQGGSSGAQMPPRCQVRITSLSDTSLAAVVAGAGRKVTLHAQIDGAEMAPEQWTWRVQFGGETIVEVVDASPEITFDVAERGLYSVTATAQTSFCSATTVLRALDPNERRTELWVRVLPPNLQTLTPAERPFTLTTDGSNQLDMRLNMGDAVAIAPKRMSSAGVMVEVPSFVRLVPRQSTFRWEGHTRSGANMQDGRFSAQIDPFLLYDVLVVPDQDFAPVLLARQTAQQVITQTLRLEQGTQVRGVARALDAPLPGVRVLLRDGDLPSTLATSDSAGGFAMWAQAGQYGAVIRAPEGSSLPDLQLPAEAGLQVPATGSVADVQISWNNLPTTAFSVQVLPPTGANALPEATIELTSTQLPNAGNLRVGDGAVTKLSGHVVRRAITNQTGQATFSALPHGAYSVRVLPPRLPGLSPTRKDVVLAGPTHTETVRLTTPVNIKGTLTPPDLAAGSVIAAYDDAQPTDAPATTTVGSDGGFRLPVAPHHKYRLRLIPGSRGTQPVVPLAAVSVGAVDVALPARVLPRGRAVQGLITDPRGAGVVNAVVQIFCVGDGSDCLQRSADGNTLSIVTAIPLAEVMTDAAGRFGVVAIDPASL